MGVVKTIHVAVGVVSDRHGRFLITRRPKDAHLGGLWEFPGGKLETGEDAHAALHRELQEETGVILAEARFWRDLSFTYPEKTVTLHFFRCSLKTDSPPARPIQVSEVRWMLVHELDPAEFPPANAPIIEALQKEA
jgi:mutator protein MutT